jgi:hypothetical protein
MPSETQKHILGSGSQLEITRNGRHKYSVGDDRWVPSVTSLTGHVEGDTFGIGANWAAKMIRESGDMDAPKNHSKEAIADGVSLHSQIETYITTGRITEEPVFLAWYQEMQDVQFIATERFIYDPSGYGGTFDAIGYTPQGLTLFDWKTKGRDSFEKYDGSSNWLKEQAQVAAYIHALYAMGSDWIPVRGVVCYVMRDGSYAVQREIDLATGKKLFDASRTISALVEDAKLQKTALGG